MTNKPCETQEINQVLDTCHPNYKSVLADSHLMDEVKRLVDEKGHFDSLLSRQMAIYFAVLRVVSSQGLLEPSIWF
jgi:hypothetical protein